MNLYRTGFANRGLARENYSEGSMNRNSVIWIFSFAVLVAFTARPSFAGPSGLVLSLTATTINENDSTTLNGSFSDADPTQTHTVDITWGDGSAITTINL